MCLLMARDYGQFFAICKVVGREKEDVILEFTQGRTASLSSLNDEDWKELMRLIRKWKISKAPISISDGDPQRKKMIAIAGKMHWGENIIEILERLNLWCKSQYGKGLNELDVPTLNRAVWVMANKIYKEYLNKL